MIEINEVQQVEVTDWQVEAQSVVAFFDMFADIPEYLIATKAAEHVFKVGGPDLRGVIKDTMCPKEFIHEQNFFTIQELAVRLNISENEINDSLESGKNYQYKQDGVWYATDTGAKYCHVHSWRTVGESGRFLKWNIDMVRNLF
jgi:hypothetical protein